MPASHARNMLRQEGFILGCAIALPAQIPYRIGRSLSLAISCTWVCLKWVENPQKDLFNIAKYSDMPNHKLRRPSRALTLRNPYSGLTPGATFLRPFGTGNFVTSLWYVKLSNYLMPRIPAYLGPQARSAKSMLTQAILDFQQWHPVYNLQ